MTRTCRTDEEIEWCNAFGQRLKEWRTSKGYSLDNVVQLSHGRISASSIVQYENGRSTPGAWAVRVLAAVYGADLLVAWLMVPLPGRG